MTLHLEEGFLQELIDGEIPSTELPPIQAHLASCAECRARLAEARELAAEADQLIETIEPPGTGAASPVGQPLRALPRRWGRHLAWAATVVIAAGTGYLARGEGSIAESVAAPADQPIELAPLTDRPEEKRADAPATGRESRRSKARPSIAPDRSADERAAAAPEQAAPATPPIPPAAGTVAPRAMRLEQSARANEIRLDELGKLSAALQRDAVPVEITFRDALTRLGGTLRLIEGLVPVRLEVLDGDVRVVYPLATGELFLEQRLANGRVTYRLVAPGDFPADSLARLRARVRE